MILSLIPRSFPTVFVPYPGSELLDAPAYIELHCHSNFSLLDGASSVEDLVARASELGMPALALTDHDAVYGVVRFYARCQAV